MDVLVFRMKAGKVEWGGFVPPKAELCDVLLKGIAIIGDLAFPAEERFSSIGTGG